MLSADRAALCCVSQLLTEECPFIVFSLHFFSSTSPTTVIALTAGPLHALISRAQLIHCWLSKLQSLLIAKHPFCSINLSLTANLSLIIGSWHLWRGGEIDSGGWVQSQRWLFREPIYNDSQQEGAFLTFIYKGALLTTRQRCCSSV